MDTSTDYIVGFDFGHGETSVSMVDVGAIDASAANIDTADLHIVGNGTDAKIPSMIGYDVDGNRLLNFDAYQFRFLKIGAYFKAPMCASDKFQAITPEDKDYFRDFVQTVFRCLHEHPKNQFLHNKKVLYFVACPSGWNDEQRRAYLEFFREYCRLPIKGVIEESRAAYVVARRKLYDRDPRLSEQGSSIAVLDLGSSTLDITMHSDRAYTDGFEIGASQIEELLLNHFLDADEGFADRYRRYAEMEPTCRNQILFLLRGAKEDYFNRQSCGTGGSLVLKCQIDWEELSADEISGVSNLKIKDTELERMLDSHGSGDAMYKERLEADIRAFAGKHGSANAVVLTGGASQMPFYKSLVLKCYGLTEHECVVDDSPSYSISRGTAIMGYLDTRGAACKPALIEQLIESMPRLIKAEIIKSASLLYAGTLVNIVAKWRDKASVKSIELLHQLIVAKLDYWQSHYDEVNRAINLQIESEVSTAVCNSLAEIVRLYFGFNAQLRKIRFDCDYDVALTVEQNQLLKTNLYRNYRKIVNEYSLFTRFAEPESMQKDRSHEPKMLERIASRTSDYIMRWFNGFAIDDEFDDIIKECQRKTRDFYNGYIEYITCQI